MSKPFAVPSFFSTVIVAAATSLVVAVAVLFASPFVRPEIAKRFPSLFPPAQPATSAVSLRIPEEVRADGAKSEDEAVTRIVKRVQPAVVAVLITAPVGRDASSFFPFDPFDPFREPSEDEGTPAPEPQRVGGGSGFFVSADGIVVTNKHVVDFDGGTYEVLTFDGKTLPAKIIATDPVLDIAFLKVEGSGFAHLEFGDSDALVPGQTVIAIGNALDQFRNSVTKGVVSGLNRRIIAGDEFASEVIEEAIQTDAAINPGNSGGPLLDLDGKVVGLNTAVSERGQLLGFALPSNLIKRDVESVKRFGKVVRPFLGVRYQLVTKELVAANQLPVDHGALIVRGSGRNDLAIAPGSPADKAGLQENDIILEIDGQRIDEDHSLSSLIGRHAPGDEVEVAYLHRGERKTVRVKLGELKTESAP